MYEEINLGLDLNSDDFREDMAEEKAEESFKLMLKGDTTLGPTLGNPLAKYVTICITKQIERDHLNALKQKAVLPKEDSDDSIVCCIHPPGDSNQFSGSA